VTRRKLEGCSIRNWTQAFAKRGQWATRAALDSSCLHRLDLRLRLDAAWTQPTLQFLPLDFRCRSVILDMARESLRDAESAHTHCFS
jgi:hypothetical protein